MDGSRASKKVRTANGGYINPNSKQQDEASDRDTDRELRRSHKARVDKARVDEARVDKTRMDKARVDKARVDKVHVGKTQERLSVVENVPYRTPLPSSSTASSADGRIRTNAFNDLGRVVKYLLAKADKDDDGLQALVQRLTQTLVGQSDTVLSDRSYVFIVALHESVSRLVTEQGLSTDGAIPAAVPRPGTAGPTVSPARNDSSPSGRSPGPSTQAPPAPGQTEAEAVGQDSDASSDSKAATAPGRGEARSQRKRRTSGGVTLDDTYQHIQEQKPLSTADGDLAPISTGSIARDLVAKLRATTVDPERDFPVADLCLLGSILLVDIFGTIGQQNFISILEECDKLRGEEMQSTFRQAAVIQELTSLGQPELATLVDEWVTVTSLIQSNRTKVGRLILLEKKVNVVRQWEQFKNRNATEALQLSEFLATQGFPLKGRQSLDSRLGQYMARLLGLTKVRNFSDRIYRWKPLAILVDTFGPGVLPFIPATVEVDYRQLRRPEAGGLHKEEKFASAVRVLSEHYPRIKEICTLAGENVMTPLLKGEKIRYNPIALEDKGSTATIYDILDADGGLPYGRAETVDEEGEKRVVKRTGEEPEDDGPEDDGPEDDGPEDDGPEDDGPEDDEPQDYETEDDEPEDYEPDDDEEEEEEEDDQEEEEEEDDQKEEEAPKAQANVEQKTRRVVLKMSNGQR